METELQIDLAKPEAPAPEVLDNALPTSGNNRADSSSRAVDDLLREPKKYVQGASRTTSQIRLTPKGERSQSPAPEQNTVAALIELGGESGDSQGSTLQPMDGGFGAWSYVASAFAMYVVVWGKFLQLLIAGNHS